MAQFYSKCLFIYSTLFLMGAKYLSLKRTQPNGSTESQIRFAGMPILNNCTTHSKEGRSIQIVVTEYLRCCLI